MPDQQENPPDSQRSRGVASESANNKALVIVILIFAMAMALFIMATLAES